MKKSMTLLAATGLFVISCVASFAQEPNSASFLLKAAPPILGEQYHCESMVRAVNALRRSGKDQALIILKGYLEEVGEGGDPRQKQKVLIMCRLLFVNEKGWQPPRLGHEDPDVDPSMIKQFPLFPIAMSHNVPFLLIRGYISGGYSGDTPEKCVESCRALNLIPADLSETDFEKAAVDLTGSDEFRKLYLAGNDVDGAKKMVLAQAKPMARLK